MQLQAKYSIDTREYVVGTLDTGCCVCIRSLHQPTCLLTTAAQRVHKKIWNSHCKLLNSVLPEGFVPAVAPVAEYLTVIILLQSDLLSKACHFYVD